MAARDGLLVGSCAKHKTQAKRRDKNKVSVRLFLTSSIWPRLSRISGNNISTFRQANIFFLFTIFICNILKIFFNMEMIFSKLITLEQVLI